MTLKYALHYFTLLTILFGSMVNAHFQMIYPASRGFDESKEPIAPCGGFDTPSSERLSIPRSAFMTIDSGHVSYSYVIRALYNENPSADDFNADNLRQLTDGTRSYPQAACLPFQFGSDVQDGTKATLQITYNGGDGLLHQCIDVIIDNTASLNTSMCYDTHGTAPNTTEQVVDDNDPQPNEGSSITASTCLALFIALGISALII